MKNKILVFGFLGSIALSGCTPLEVGRTLWGSSTRVLEGERVNGISAVYDCSISDCYDVVLNMADAKAKAGVALHDTGNYNFSKPTYNGEPQEAASDEAKENAQKIVEEPPPFSVLFKDRRKSRIVVINIPGNIDTTEVGIFFSYMENGTKIDISSLSSTAKRTVAGSIFNELDKKYKRILDEKKQ